MKRKVFTILVLFTTLFVVPVHAQGWGRLSKVGEAVRKNEYILKAAATKGVARGTDQLRPTATTKPGDDVEGNAWPFYGFVLLALVVITILYFFGIIGDGNSGASHHIVAPTRPYIPLANGGGIMYL